MYMPVAISLTVWLTLLCTGICNEVLNTNFPNCF